MARRFAITWDYRCPFARNAHDHVVTGLRAGAGWEVSFVPFSLGQVHVGEGEPSVWDRPDADSGLMALQMAVAVRDLWPERFLDVHHAVFELRHTDGGDLRDRAVLGRILSTNGLDPEKVWAHVDGGAPLAIVKSEHEAVVASHHVWGVPTFLVGSSAVFVRLMQPAAGDADLAITTIERLLDQIGWPILNELKHTTIPR